MAAENGKDPEKRELLRQALRLQKGLAEQHVCANCHDGDNSPEFKFETYWPKVETARPLS